MKTPRNFLLMLWRFRLRLRIEADGVTVTPYDPHGRVSPLLVEECRKRSADILDMARKYIAEQEAHCAEWKESAGQPLTVLAKAKRKTAKLEQGRLI